MSLDLCLLLSLEIHLIFWQLVLLILKSVLEHNGSKSPISVFEPHFLNLVHFNNSLLDNFSLLPDAEAFHIVEADTHQGVKLA